MTTLIKSVERANYCSFVKPAKFHRNSNLAFQDAEYAGTIEHFQRGFSFTPYFVTTAALLLICATIAVYFLKG